MEYKQLEYFVKICETHSFSAAARELYVTPQGISKSIDKLEKELGVPLFARTRTGIELTAMGQELYKHARPHLKQWEYIKERVAGTEKRSRQSLAIGFDEGTLDQYAVQFLPDFLSAHPEDEISVRCFPGTECQQEVLEGRVDVGFALPPVDAELFDVLCGATYPLQLVVCKSHRLAGRASVRLSELRGERLVDLNAPTPGQKKLLQHCAELGVFPSVVLNGSHWERTVALCRTAGVVSFYGGPREWLPDDLALVGIADASAMWGNVAFVRKHRYLTDLAREFIDYCAKAQQAH